MAAGDRRPLARVVVRIVTTDRDQRDFLRRSRGGAGRYVTPADIARRNPIVLSDVFRHTAGVRLDGNGPNTVLSLRGCRPDV